MAAKIGSNYKNTGKAKAGYEPFRQAVRIAMRAIAADAQLDVSFGRDRPGLTANSARLPDLPTRPTRQTIALTRGWGDSLSLRKALHCDAAHAALRPLEDGARAVYDTAEQIRVEALGARAMRGVGQNLAALVAEQCRSADYKNAGSRDDVPRNDAIALLLREKLIGRSLPAEAAKALELWRSALEPDIDRYIADFRRNLADQSAFARSVRAMLSAMHMAEHLEAEPAQPADEPQAPDAEQPPEDDAKQGENSSADSDKSGDKPDDGGSGEETAEDAAERMEEERENQTRELRESKGSETSEEAAAGARSLFAMDNLGDYKIYTTAFDEITDAAELCSAAELDSLRSMLDTHLSALQGVVGRLANRLQRRLQAQQNRAWDFDQEEGLIDSARLSRIITDPSLPLSYKREREAEFRDTVVSLLIDNSGSMRGRPITVAAICADILARTLERCGVKVEILGFTTKAWKGGKAREQWLKSGKPAAPGRLNDIRHIIYKSADSPWRRVRRNLGLMMREGLLKENIDGEALIWAHKRLLDRQEKRRILMVISDGAPVDDSTLSVNSGNYLERHLRAVIKRIETQSPVELMAIGIGHDVRRYYRRALTIVGVEELAGAMTGQLAELFDQNGKDRQRCDKFCALLCRQKCRKGFARHCR